MNFKFSRHCFKISFLYQKIVYNIPPNLNLLRSVGHLCGISMLEWQSLCLHLRYKWEKHDFTSREAFTLIHYTKCHNSGHDTYSWSLGNTTELFAARVSCGENSSQSVADSSLRSSNTVKYFHFPVVAKYVLSGNVNVYSCSSISRAFLCSRNLFAWIWLVKQK